LVSLSLPSILRSKPLRSTPEPVDNESVKEFVLAGHGNLAKVKEMVNEIPNLIYCRYDWGGGDFEEAIEGAGHVGNKEIANYLIGQGARVNLFVLTMLGKTNLVKPVLEEYPNLIFAKGPHGLSLLHHAEKGGEGATELYEYLYEKGLEETKYDMY
jgi:hypothetical protein